MIHIYVANNYLKNKMKQSLAYHVIIIWLSEGLFRVYTSYS